VSNEVFIDPALLDDGRDRSTERPVVETATESYGSSLENIVNPHGNCLCIECLRAGLPSQSMGRELASL
jgi:hypothetical protein